MKFFGTMGGLKVDDSKDGITVSVRVSITGGIGKSAAAKEIVDLISKDLKFNVEASQEELFSKKHADTRILPSKPGGDKNTFSGFQFAKRMKEAKTLGDGQAIRNEAEDFFRQIERDAELTETPFPGNLQPFDFSARLKCVQAKDKDLGLEMVALINDMRPMQKAFESLVKAQTKAAHKSPKKEEKKDVSDKDRVPA